MLLRDNQLIYFPHVDMNEHYTHSNVQDGSNNVNQSDLKHTSQLDIVFMNRLDQTASPIYNVCMCVNYFITTVFCSRAARRTKYKGYDKINTPGHSEKLV